MTHYIFDIEVFPNFFSAIFIDISTSKEYIREYIEADIDRRLDDKAIALKKINPKIFVIYDKRNDIRELKRFIDSSRECMFIGYNNIDYDNIVIDYIFTTNLSGQPTSIILESIKTMNDNLIGYDGWNFRKDYNVKYSYRYITVDLYKLNYLDKPRISLKQIEIALKWYKVKELVLPPPEFWEIETFYEGNSLRANNLKSHFDRYIIDEFVEDVIDYNVNDVLATLSLLDYSKVELRQRFKAIERYGAGGLSDSRSTLADKLMSSAYGKRTGYRYFSFIKSRTYRSIIPFRQIISPMVEFNTPELQAFLKEMKGYVLDVVEDVGVNKFKMKVLFRDTTYTIAKGGLHSVDKPQRFDTNERYKLKDIDATSYYPYGIINMRVVPAHVSPSILDVISQFTETRVKAKKLGDKDEADILKIVINSIFGKMGSEGSWLYDLKAMYTITVNLQLFLLMLVELLENNGIHVISANTDGLVCKIPVEKVDLYYKVCKVWGKHLSFGVEFTDYDMYARTGVNSYICILSNGSFKLKGEFLDKKPINMGYYAPIIAKALQAYYKYGTTIEEFLHSKIKPDDIYDFCISIKVGNQFETIETGIKDGAEYNTILQKNNRYYVSTNNTILRKRRKDTNRYTSILKGYNLTVFNDFYYVPEFKDYKINYRWYISRILETIQRINREVHPHKTKTINTGRLFDEIE